MISQTRTNDILVMFYQISISGTVSFAYMDFYLGCVLQDLTFGRTSLIDETQNVRNIDYCKSLHIHKQNMDKYTQNRREYDKKRKTKNMNIHNVLNLIVSIRTSHKNYIDVFQD